MLGVLHSAARWKNPKTGAKENEAMAKNRGWGSVAAIAAMTVVAFSPATLHSAETAVKGEDGKYMTSEGMPTYHIGSDGAVDWYTYSGYRRYHADCHTCHGPDGQGSSYAPALAHSLKTLTYEQFMDVVVNGRQKVGVAENQVMPAFAQNVNVMCYIDDLYVYLKARADDAVPRGRPAKREDKPKVATQNEDSCLGRGG
jgi:methanol metabolism-related c-type cytochrome